MFLSTESGKPLHKSPNTKKIQMGRLFGIYQPNWWYGYLFSLQNKPTKHTQMLFRLWGKDDVQSITRQRTCNMNKLQAFCNLGNLEPQVFFAKNGGANLQVKQTESPTTTHLQWFRTAKVKTVSTIEREHMMADFARRAARWIFGNWWNWLRGLRLLHVWCWR